MLLLQQNNIFNDQEKSMGILISENPTRFFVNIEIRRFRSNEIMHINIF